MRPRHVSSLAIVASALLCSVAAGAAPRGDTNGDGRLSLTEFQSVTQTRFMRADKDSDGRISLQEWLGRPAAAKAKHDPSKRFNRLDANKDGQLDTAEIEALVKRRFAALDKNADGAITDEERPGRKAAESKSGGAADDDPDGAAMDDDAEGSESGQQSAQ
jgi:EF hand